MRAIKRHVSISLLWILFLSLSSCSGNETRSFVAPTPSMQSGILLQSTITPPNETRGPQLVTPEAVQDKPSEAKISFTASNEPIENLQGRDLFPNIGMLSLTKNEILILDPNGKVVFQFAPNNPNDSLIDFVESPQECKLVLTVHTGSEIQLIDISIASEETAIVAAPHNDEPNTNWWTWPKLSPSGKYVSYLIWSGNINFDSAQYEDIEIVEMGGNARQRITHNGGAWKSNGVWSPSEDKIAFSDFDSLGISQLFVYSVPLKERQLVTDFANSTNRVSYISWSPQGTRIIFISENEYGQNTQNSDLWLIDLLHNQSTRLRLPDPPYTIGENIYWDKEGKRLLLNMARGENEYLYWLNLEKVAAYHILQTTDIENTNQNIEVFSHLFPFSDDNSVVGFVSNNKIYRYDLATGKITPINIESLGSDWSIDKIKPLKNEFSKCTRP